MGTVERAVVRSLWLPPMTSSVLCWLAYGVGRDESGSRAGAEATVAGLIVATPAVMLVFVQVCCALCAVLAQSWRQLTACVAASSLGALLLILMVVALDGTPGVRHDVAVAAMVLPPLVPGWISIGVARRVSAPVQA